MMIKYLSVVALIVFLFTFANCENWSVNVGDAGNKVFEPPNFDANVGDTVTFNFVDGNHDVVQADTFATCAKSVLPNAFSTPVYTGNAAAPSTAVWTLTKAGPLYYYCDVEEHCPKHIMYATINVLEAGAALKVPGVKSVPPPATLKTPTPTNGTAPPTPAVSSAVRTDKQISIAVLCGALLSLTRYFLI
ncbi:unnamed protein product [Rhizophagus irregularis]|uniref:Phytocyanin domain-containing protein n=1 Tax=Rhizophagus irregularis TaxID=588596 RepID=A0A2N1MXF1_9GLOM|nr:hypothetical protein RhiirC2_852967 [Rhizophagus irregularis]CAB4401633.1 unnamed protein product [Rhizophagus irregularis]CAB5294126.1 unnamed protein product [Rhizophagus irregularis]